MGQRAELVRAERDIVRYCHAGFDVDRLQRQVLRSLRRLMSVDAVFFATADPETLLFTGGYAEEPLDAVTPMFLANEFGCADVNKFASLVVSERLVATLDGATRRDRATSARSRDIMKPLGLGDELRAALVAGSDCWGYLCLHREDHPLGFTSSEAATIRRLSPHIAHALRQAALLRSSTTAPRTDGPGVVLLAPDLSVVAITEQAETLLSLVANRGATGLPLPIAVYAVAAALIAGAGGTTTAPALPSTRVQTRGGQWLNVHASHLHGAQGDGQIAIVVEPLEKRATAQLVLSAYGLSVREAEVARMVLRGASTRAIVDSLHISAHTVQDHLKSVFDKTGVRSRRELVGRFLH